MERAGWQEGQGLGVSTIGISEPITTEGAKLSAKDRSGLGYTGEKVDRNPNKRFSTGQNRSNESGIRITTIYDDPEETDPVEPFNRRSNPTTNKNRTRQTKTTFTKP